MALGKGNLAAAEDNQFTVFKHYYGVIEDEIFRGKIRARIHYTP